MTANHIARMSAKRLMPKFGDGLPFAVEKVIQSDAAEPGQFIDVGALAALATLVVQCAQFAFDWKRSRSGGEGKPDIEALKRELRLELGRELPEGVSEKARDEVVEAIAEEMDGEAEE